MQNSICRPGCQMQVISVEAYFAEGPCIACGHAWKFRINREPVVAVETRYIDGKPVHGVLFCTGEIVSTIDNPPLGVWGIAPCEGQDSARQIIELIDRLKASAIDYARPEERRRAAEWFRERAAELCPASDTANAV